MSNFTGAELVTAVKQRSGRTNDAVLITTSFVLQALNEAQLQIVKMAPRIVSLDKSDTTTYSLTTADTSFDISTLAPAHIGGIWILNGAATRKKGLKYRELTEFRRKYIPVASEGDGEPFEYTRQGNDILFNMPVASDFNGLFLQIDYTAFATDLLNDGTASELPDSNKGLILFALADVYDEIALSMPRFESKALKTRVLYDRWFDDYKDYQTSLIETLYGDNPW